MAPPLIHDTLLRTGRRSIHGKRSRDEVAVSRAFVREDDNENRPRRSYPLPPRDDPGYDHAAARALLEGARVGDIASAEEATGYAWGAPELRSHVEQILAWAEAEGDERLAQVAERFLR
jgi:hypothetical protein